MLQWLKRLVMPLIKCDFCEKKFPKVYAWHGYSACNPCIVQRVQWGCTKDPCSCTNGIGCVNTPYGDW